MELASTFLIVDKNAVASVFRLEIPIAGEGSIVVDQSRSLGVHPSLLSNGTIIPENRGIWRVTKKYSSAGLVRKKFTVAISCGSAILQPWIRNSQNTK